MCCTYKKDGGLLIIGNILFSLSQESSENKDDDIKNDNVQAYQLLWLQQTLRAWKTVFVTGALISIVCTTQYIIFATDKVQPWNEPKGKIIKGKKS